MSYNKEDIILLGGGGHCFSTIDVIEAENKFRIQGILDVKENVGKKILGYDIIGIDSDIDKYLTTIKYYLVTAGQIKSALIRVKLFEFLKSKQCKLPVIIAPDAVVSKNAEIGEGTVVFHKAVINAGCNIGVNTIINTSAIIEHRTKIGDHTHISTAAVVNGDCTIGCRTFIGSNATIKQEINITNEVIVGAGSIVISDLIDKGIYYGAPARKKY
jgi:sugar O-acyltransferase, sialic acid O-acetyltransferase NeuD family